MTTFQNTELHNRKGPRPLKVAAPAIPPPPPEIDLSDADLLVIKAAKRPAGAMRQTENLTLNVMSYDDFILSTPADSSKRSRQSRRFSLNLRNRAEYELSCWIDTLVRGREYHRVIRDALRLFRDLRAGNYAVLRELFPGVFERILQENCTPASQQFDALLREIHDLKLTQMTAGQGELQQEMRKLDSLLSDDDAPALTIRKAKSTGNSASNFLDSAFNLIK